MENKNPLIKINLRAMEFIWNEVPKTERDGIQYIVYEKSDIPFLYYSGLVDTQRYRLEQWEKAFEDCLDPNTGYYYLSHPKFLSLGRFRYCKTVGEPFDPMKMREGQYTADRLWRVFESSVIPSCALPPEFLKNLFDGLVREKKSLQDLYGADIKKNEDAEKEFNKIDLVQLESERKFEGDLVIVERKSLINLKNLLDTYPSPRRKMEIAVYNMRTDKLQALADVAINPQKSSFEAGADFRETTKKSLKDMLVKASENATGGRKPTGEVINVGDLQKQKRPPTKF